MAPKKPRILLCDGTWCGRETSTRTNVYLLAKYMGIPINDPTDTDVHVIKGKARYIHGVGLGSTFLDYIFNGITAQDIATQCISAYKFIVLNYTYPDNEIWLFGLSRGAYTVRCVAGMINNCGIVKPKRDKDGNINEQETNLLCEKVYRIYRSPYAINSPGSPQSKNFRKESSWPLIGDEDKNAVAFTPPVKFMGLFDTVGSLGLPSFTGGVGLEWPKFYDENVSTVVENVYQAVSLHDRLYVFEPCLVKRDMKKHKGKPKDFGITQVWFPGVHYDLGRQRFKFLRDFGGGLLESILARWGWASKVIEPNEVLADLVMRWMLQAVQQHDPQGEVIPDVRVRITAVENAIVEPNAKIGDGDVYGHVLDYAPFGSIILKIWRAIYGTRGTTNQIYQLLFALRDRLVPENDATVYDFQNRDPTLPGFPTTLPIAQLAGIPQLTLDNADANKRYPSAAYYAWELG